MKKAAYLALAGFVASVPAQISANGVLYDETSNPGEVYAQEIYYVSTGNIETIDNPNIYNFPGGAKVKLIKVEGAPPFKTGDAVEVTVSAGEGFDEYEYRSAIDANVGSEAYLWLPEGEYEFRANGYVSARAAVSPRNDSVLKLYANDKEGFFRDVRESDWFYEAVVYALDGGLFVKGASGEFKPDSQTTRDVLAALIGRFHGANLAGYDYSSFDDVPKDKPCSPYIEWAKDAGIIAPVSEKNFEPDRPVTREEIAAALLNYYKHVGGKDLEIVRKYERFTDYDLISDYAKPAAEALQNLDIIVGKPGNIFDPFATVTRAETAQMLYLLGKIIFVE
jgi:hypothetical protein